MHTFAFKLRSQFTRKLDGARCIAMDTNRFAAHIDVTAFDGMHFAFAQHSQHTPSGFFGIAEQCIRAVARNQPAVI